MATSDATVTAPKLGYKMRVFPALVWDLNTLFIPWQSISHSVPREMKLCLGQLWTYNPHTGSISLPYCWCCSGLKKDLMLALYLSATSGHSPSWARTCLTCAGCPWSSLVRVLFIFVCALRVHMWAHVLEQEITLECCSSGTVHLFVYLFIFTETVLSTTCQIG